MATATSEFPLPSPLFPHPSSLHPVVPRAATAFRWNPCDDLVRIHDVAGLAVNTVRRVDLQPRAAVLTRHDFVNVSGTKPDARMAVFFPAYRVTDLCMYQQMRRLILDVARSREMHVRQFVE